MRMPRMHGFPPHFPGSTVMRSNDATVAIRFSLSQPYAVRSKLGVLIRAVGTPTLLATDQGFGFPAPRQRSPLLARHRCRCILCRSLNKRSAHCWGRWSDAFPKAVCLSDRHTRGDNGRWRPLNSGAPTSGGASLRGSALPGRRSWEAACHAEAALPVDGSSLELRCVLIEGAVPGVAITSARKRGRDVHRP